MDTPTPPRLLVRMLGGFTLSGADGEELTLPRKKMRALVALLAMAPAAGWPRERLTALLWGDRDEEQARGSLRQALAELRRMVGDSALRIDRDTAAFNPAVVRVDAEEFARPESWSRRRRSIAVICSTASACPTPGSPTGFWSSARACTISPSAYWRGC
jgi:DNA-binding SARP family transcriptional activator